jgi:hypothetical protein
MIEFSDSDLEAYIDESLDPSRAADLESALKRDKKLIERLAQINSRRDAGVHTLGEIWRQNQIGVPSREQMESYVVGNLPEEFADYIHFRLEVLRCRYTNALLDDVEAQEQTGAKQAAAKRRKKYIDSSVGIIRNRKKID